MNTSVCCSPSVLTSAKLPQPPAGHTIQSYFQPQKSYYQQQNRVMSPRNLDSIYFSRSPAQTFFKAVPTHTLEKRKCSSVVNEEVEMQFTEKLRGLTKLPGHTISHAMPPQPQPIPSLNTLPEKDIGNINNYFFLTIIFINNYFLLTPCCLSPELYLDGPALLYK